MFALMGDMTLDLPVLDLGAGSGWISEFCSRMGLNVIALDIHSDLERCLGLRVRADRRIDGNLIRYAVADGHDMPLEEKSVGHVLCFDSLHHMRDFPKLFREVHRVLAPGGRCIFVEPGARHSSSPETVAFVEAHKADDPEWLERDIVVEEIDVIARDAGFKDGIRLVPAPLAIERVMHSYSVESWKLFRGDDRESRRRFCQSLSEINYWERVIFFADRGL
jgi:SAM-dependent methyltransferase